MTSDEQSSTASPSTSRRRRRPQQEHHHQQEKADDVTSSTSSSSASSINNNNNNDVDYVNINTETTSSSHSNKRTTVTTPVYQTPSTSNRQSSTSSERYASNSASSFQHKRQRNQNNFGSPFQSPPVSLFDNEESMEDPQETRKRQPQRYHQQQQQFDSPFLSPLPSKQHHNSHHSRSSSRKERPQPLVLDPNATRNTTNTPASYHSRYTSQQQHDFSSAHSARSLPVVQQFLQAATTSLKEHHATKNVVYNTQSNNNAAATAVHVTPLAAVHNNHHYSTTTTTSTIAASTLAQAQSTSMAGFLWKLGTHIPEFKRRFFLIKAETNLYYYLSPNDVEPRGRIDLEGSTVKLQERFPDGRMRFVVEWEQHQSDNDNTDDDDKPPRIVLEARSQDIGDEWIKVMQQERVSTLKTQVNALSSETTAQKNKIVDLERQLAHYAKVEEDRDGALEDAHNWRTKFEKLDEALRLLTQQVRQAPQVDDDDDAVAGDITTTSDDDKQPESSHDVSFESGEEEKKEDDGDDLNESSNNQDKNGTNDTSNVTESTPTLSNREKSKPALLDDFMQHDDMNVEEMLDVPGTYFSSLSNACRQQKESLRLAYVEASTAVEDVVKANEQVETVEKRMQKAEKQLLKLWEENCSIRNTLKQKKRERRVLVKEVKHLQETVKQMQEESEKRENLRLYSMKAAENDGPMADTIIGSDEERLIDELEAHVASSIKLHERLLVGNDVVVGRETDLNTSLDESIFTADHGSIYRSNALEGGIDPNVHKSDQIFRDPIPSGGKLLSLFDDEDDSDSESSMDANERQGMKPLNILEDFHSVAPSVSSTMAEFGDNEVRTDSVRSNRLIPANSSIDSPEGTPMRPNPLLRLDSDETEVHERREYQKSPTAITKNGRATTRLVCPLADVVDTKAVSKVDADRNEDLQVQHLTFYSKKIGIQFQKAPPAPVKPRGLLTEALTADLNGEANASQNGAVQLQSIASIASLANGSRASQGSEHCPLALPEDIVLVCGFHGFDDSGTNQRPKLGARLVAFDGVSVEVGKWTFDSIRKAIKMRGRPLTLSFRNDFLTTEQRAVLTKAVMDVDAKTPRQQPMVQHAHHPSTSLSIHSGISHETDNFVNTSAGNQYQIHRRGNSESGRELTGRMTGESQLYYHPPPSSNSSLSSGYREPPVRRLSSTSISTSNHNFRSFSDAGSSVVSSSLAPLMANLLKGVSSSSSEHGSRHGKRFEPEYLRREPERLDQTPQHQDFQSNLL